MSIGEGRNNAINFLFAHFNEMIDKIDYIAIPHNRRVTEAAYLRASMYLVKHVKIRTIYLLYFDLLLTFRYKNYPL